MDSNNVGHQALLDALPQGILIFDGANRLIAENAAARALFGNDLRLIRTEGWAAAAMVFNRTRVERTVDEVRAEALATGQPVRFHTFRAGAYIPGWMTPLDTGNGKILTIISIETPDWSPLTELMTRFLLETRDAVEDTQGHIAIISQSLKHAKPDDTVDKVRRQIGGFVQLIGTQMYRSGILIDLTERLEQVRTGRVRERVREGRQQVSLSDFFERFVADMETSPLLDPEMEMPDIRSRLHLDIPDGLSVAASPLHLARILRDILRNAMMYSAPETDVTVTAQANESGVQISVADRGYGIRAGETDRVFRPFQRARQPQIMGEFGYGLSLYLCKHEVEAMNGRIWFESEEGAGSTFSFRLPMWRDDATATQEYRAFLSSSSSDI